MGLGHAGGLGHSVHQRGGLEQEHVIIPLPLAVAQPAWAQRLRLNAVEVGSKVKMLLST